MSSSSSSIFYETPPSSSKLPPGPRSATEDDDDDFIVEDSSSSLESSHNSAEIISSSSTSDLSQQQIDDDEGAANDDGDAEDKENLRGSQSQQASTPVPSIKPGSMDTVNTLDVTAMEPLHSNLNLTFGGSAAKPPFKPFVNPMGTTKKPEKKQRRRVISFDDSSDEEGRNVSVTPDKCDRSSNRHSNMAKPESQEVPVANSSYSSALGWEHHSTEDIEKDLNVFTSDDEVDNLAKGMETVLIAEKEPSSSKRDSRQRSSNSHEDYMTLFAQPESSQCSSDVRNRAENNNTATKKATTTGAAASKGFTFKQKEPAPDVLTLDSDSDPNAEIFEEQQPHQREKNSSSNPYSSSTGNLRYQGQSSDGTSVSQATVGAAGSSTAFTFKQKEPVPAVFTVDSDSDSLVEIEADFGGLKIAGEVKPRKVPSPRKTVFLPDLPVSKPSQSVSSHGRFIIADETESLLKIDRCIQNLTRELENAPKETDELGPAPARLTVQLHPHQSYALEWLSWRENQSPFGGILADEMGLGKTVMMLALICRSKEAAPNSKDNGNGWKSSTERNLVEARATLVVCPASVMGQWEAECNSKAPTLKVLLWHGSNREKSASRLAKYDLVVTSYNTVGSEIPKETEQLVCNSPLLKVKWKRIILDEGHIIRNPGTTMAQAACRLFASHRWLVTGTPIHNKAYDFYSIVKFLHFEPFDDLKVWEQWIGKKFPNSRQTQRLQAIGKALLLRRTKLEIAAGPESHQKIPEKTVQDVMVTLKEEEREVYDHIQSSLKEQFQAMLKDLDTRQRELQKTANAFVAGGRQPKAAPPAPNMAQMFVILLRCRQAAVLPRLVITMLDEEEDDDEEFDPDLHLCSLKNPVFEPCFVSSKLERLYEDLLTLRNEARSRGVPMDKAIIVSQWTSLLQIIDIHLGDKGFRTVSITGQTPISDRTDIMLKFNANKRKPEIMLLSLTAGGCGLNLIGANHLFFMDIHWNPQLELQAQDRIHRFGQTKPVRIVRYISEGTIENRVLELQSQKLDLANGLLTGASVSKRSGAGLSIAEMRKLFDL